MNIHLAYALIYKKPTIHPLSLFPGKTKEHRSIFTFTLHYTLFTLHSSLFTIHSSLFTHHSSLFTHHSSLFTLHSSLPFPPHAQAVPDGFRGAFPVTVFAEKSKYTVARQEKSTSTIRYKIRTGRFISQ